MPKVDEIVAQDGEMQFHHRAKALKLRKGLTAKAVAEACDVTESTLSRYLKGASVPPEDIARKIMQYLNSQPDKKIDENMGEDMQAVIDIIRSLYEGRIADLKDIIANMRTEHAEGRKFARRERWVLLGLVAVLLAAFGYVLIDALNSGWGLFKLR